MPTPMTMMREPTAEELDRQPMVDLIGRVREVSSLDALQGTSGRSMSTIGRVLRMDPTVGYAARVDVWKAATLILEQSVEERRRQTSLNVSPGPLFQPDQAIHWALRSSHRTAPCGNALHIFGQPQRSLDNQALSGIVDQDLTEFTLTHSVCPVNSTSWHIPDRLVDRMARRVRLVTNIWGEALLVQE